MTTNVERDLKRVVEVALLAGFSPERINQHVSEALRLPEEPSTRFVLVGDMLYERSPVVLGSRCWRLRGQTDLDSCRRWEEFARGHEVTPLYELRDLVNKLHDQRT